MLLLTAAVIQAVPHWTSMDLIGVVESIANSSSSRKYSIGIVNTVERGCMHTIMDNSTLLPYTYKFSRYIIFMVEQFSGFSHFYFQGLPSIQKYSWVLFSRIFCNVWSCLRSRISAWRKILFTVCTSLANNTNHCLIAWSNEIIEGRGTRIFAYFISFCLGWILRSVWDEDSQEKWVPHLGCV